MTEECVSQNIEQNTESTDGNFIISLHDQGVYLTVYPPQSEGVPVTESKVIEELKQKHIENYNYPVLVRTIKEASGNEVKIAEAPPPEVEPDIQIIVSRDRMEAMLQIIKPKNSKPLTMEAVMEKIQQSGIVFGIDHEIVQQAFERPGLQLTFAKGQRPVDGDNAYIKHHIDLESKGRPVELENGQVDFKNLNMFTTVRQGELLAEKISATPGTPGTDLMGKVVPAKPGRDIMMPLGKNVEVVDNYKIVATTAGQLMIANNKINVIPVIEVKGDVDLSTGNIEFVGNVVVRGSVQTGFTIKAEGNVEVYGTVSGGTVEGRNVIIKMGIQGMHRGYIKAAENVVAKFIENATIYAGNDIVVSEVILHSKVSAGKRILVQGKRGLIAGGTVIAGEEIRVKIAGTQMSTSTELEVGVNPMLREEYQYIRKEMKKVEITLDQTQKALNILKSMNQSTMPPDKREMLLKLTKAQFHLVGQVETMRNRITEIELAFEEMKHGSIRIADVVYPGVKIVVGQLIKPIREVLKYVSFFVEDGEIKIGAFN